MRSRSAFSRSTKTSDLPSTKVYQPFETGTVSSAVFFREIVVLPKPSAGSIDIDDLVAEFEQTPESAKAIAKGRKWVADTFYGDQNTSIAKLRLQKGWSQAELARQADTSQPYIARLELGKVDPQLSTVRKLAKALGVSLPIAVQAISPEDEQ